MTFQGSGPLDTTTVSSGGRGGGLGGGLGGGNLGGGRIAMGGGLGLVVTLIALFLGVNPGNLLGDMNAPAPDANSANDAITQHIQQCTIEKANTDSICRIVGTVDSLNTVWPQLLPGYTAPKTKIFSGAVNTACGPAS